MTANNGKQNLTPLNAGVQLGVLAVGATLVAGLFSAGTSDSPELPGGTVQAAAVAKQDKDRDAGGSHGRADDSKAKDDRDGSGDEDRDPKADEPAKPDESKDDEPKNDVQADDVIKLAEKQIGIAENGSGSTKFQDWYMSTDRAEETVRRDGGDIEGYSAAAWCSMFISWLGTELDFSDQMGQDAWTVAHAEWFKDQDRWGTTPRPGAVVFFNWAGGKSLDDIEHVGLVVEDNRDGTIKTVEGNTDNAVRERERSTSDVVGYGYPEYAK